MRKLPGTVYWAKGVIYTRVAPQQRAVLQVVGRRVGISIQEEWGQHVPRTQIVAIGAADGIDSSLLERTVAAYISPATVRHMIAELSTSILYDTADYRSSHARWGDRLHARKGVG